MIRTHLVKALYQNLVGPKNGVTEAIEQPFGTYQVGVLTSCFHSKNIDDRLFSDPSEKNFQAQIHRPAEYSKSVEDNDVEWPDTELDMDGSFTLGLSFVISGNNPKIKVCSTWGRYEYSKQFPTNLNIMQRKPNYYLTEWLNVKSFENHDKKINLVENENGSVISMHGVELYLRSSMIPDKDNHWAVQVFLVNKTKFQDRDNDGKPKRQDEIHRVFQPQIRINVDKDSVVEALRDMNYNNDRTDSLLFRERVTKARGFQCGAVWKEIDPEVNNMEDGFNSFTWPDKDSGIIPKKIVDEFTCPEIRTEYLPPYAILQPETSQNKYDAFELSNFWESEALHKALDKITKNYSKWIQECRDELEQIKGEISESEHSAGMYNLKKCEESLYEIEQGKNFVCNDERARLAFCFMNSVMYEKKKNDDNDALEWYEFQMAFILQSIRGVAGKGDETEPADVLWFPTGGGKTEAYLGSTVFAIAYRRLLKMTNCKHADGELLNNDGGVNVISRYTLRLLTIQQFQRALGAIIVSDLRRVENWIPKDLEKAGTIKDPELSEKFKSGRLWGRTRFSIGLWIGGDSTPIRFAYMRDDRGRVILNAEGALLSNRDPIKSNVQKSSKGDPAQIQNCPVCKNLLCFPQSDTNKITNNPEVTWIIKTKKTILELESIPKSEFTHPHRTVVVDDGPYFSVISQAPNGKKFIRVKMKISMPNIRNVRNDIDNWWADIVEKHLSTDGAALESTRAAMPGYFFLSRPGENIPYDFAIHCTSEGCKLNKTRWFGGSEGSNSVPDAFLEKSRQGVSNSIPISAFTVDEQVYAKCPTLIIATVDKFANLPWDPRCASIFGNVDCFHEFFGFGRRSYFQAPILNRKKRTNERITPDDSEYVDVHRFLPPSLIIQDELHLIEGPLGSMVGVYEMAVDALCSRENLKPKYIASSATIKEADKQVKTIFRKDIRIFPHPGISASNNFFAKTDEDNSCTKSESGRLYVGICSAKSVFELPIKICAILMSEIHRIKENPGLYGISKHDIKSAVDPYWTYVSYFSDLQLMSRFSGFYGDDIERDVNKFSPSKIGNGYASGTGMFPGGARLVPVTATNDLVIHGISVYCKNSVGNISVSLYDKPSEEGTLIWQSNAKKCSNGENAFDNNGAIFELMRGREIWVGILNDNPRTTFRTVKQKQWYEITQSPQQKMTFPPKVGRTKRIDSPVIQVELVGKRRNLKSDQSVIQLSSETSSEELPKHLEKLDEKLSVDALLTSPVFGTGIDIDRLGLMNVMTQPKTTSGYIQATGRVGRKTPGLVVTWLNARRARDLDHYENFVGYHRKIHSHVEPITANPFSEESLELSLGPIIVSILRNAKKISGTAIDYKWINDPIMIVSNKNGNSPDVNSVRNFLMSVASDNLIPVFRRPENFEQLLGVELRRWDKLVEDHNPDEIIYGERNPTKPVEKNVILGSPFHEQRGYSAAFRNTRNSLRDTEPTSMFYRQHIKIPIRPSQFITRYGPGSLLPADACSITSPSIHDMVGDLNSPIGNFEEQVDGKKGLTKISIEDFKMTKMLRRFNPDVEPESIRIFEMPTNASLNSRKHPVADHGTIFKSKIFPEWAVCSKHAGDRILSKITYHPTNRKMVVKCPHCQTQFQDMYSTDFSSVRFVMACRSGHMYDVEWNDAIHKHVTCNRNDDDESRVFIWNESGKGDDIGFNCYGVWTGAEKDVFQHTTCNAQTQYSKIKHDSSEGYFECKGMFVEDSSGSGTRCSALPRIVRKSMMSLRSPIILSSLVIQQKKSMLFNHLWPYAYQFILAKRNVEKETPDWTPCDLAKELEADREITGMGKLLIRDVKNELKSKLEQIADDLTKELKKENSGKKIISEREELEEELKNLEKGIEEYTQIRPGSAHGITRAKFPINWDSKISNLRFEAMPYSDIRVTMVQTGYSREIPDTLQEREDEAEDLLQLRKGEVINRFSKFDDPETKLRWYLGNQSIGEGIFIHLDPREHKDSSDIFTRGNNALEDWSSFHKDIIRMGQDAKNQTTDARRIDLIESAQTKSNPLFVWWHTLAHQIIAELAIDSGFATTALKERVYCIERDEGFSTGILIYVSAPGSDGTLGGLTSLVADDILPEIVDNAMNRLRSCSNDPVCSERIFTRRRHRGVACHACVIAPETSCSYQNKFLDRNLVKESWL